MQKLVKQKPTLLWITKMNEGDEILNKNMVNRCDKILDTYLHNLTKAKETTEIWKAIENAVKGFDKLNMEDDNFVDMIGREEIVDFINDAAEMYGLRYEGDVTEEYRTDW